MSSEPSEVSTLVIVSSELEATLIADALNDRKIQAHVSGGTTGGSRALAPGSVRVLVHTDDFAAARKALDDFRQEIADIDWSKVDVGEPED